MNGPKCQAEDYIDFLVASPKVCSAKEAARVQPEERSEVAHDAFSRLLTRVEPSSEALWEEVQGQVKRKEGLLVIDDTTLDKPYAKHIDMVSYHWSGKHHKSVRGINLVTVVWTDGDQVLPCDYCVVDKNEGKSKNDLFGEMIRTAKERGFQPNYVAFDGWYSSLRNLKLVRDMGWFWLTRLKSNRRVNPDGKGNVSVDQISIDMDKGSVVHLEGYGFIRVFRIVSKDGDTDHWATNDLTMNELTRLMIAEQSWAIEHYHRGIKQFCGVERCQSRSARAQRNHIGFSLRAFLRIERWCFRSGFSWFEAKHQIIRSAIQAYLAQPLYVLHSTA